MLSNFWENERPSSSDDESESEIHSGGQIVENIETVKDLDLSKNELKFEIRKLEYKLKSYQNKLQNQRSINRRLKKELKSSKEKFNLFENCESL